MPVLTAMTVLILMQLLGEALIGVTGVPLPGSLVGLLLLFVYFVWRGRVPRGLRDTAGHVLPHMAVLFIAPVAALVQHIERIQAEWLAVLVACLLSGMLTIMVTAYTLRWMLARRERQEEG